MTGVAHLSGQRFNTPSYGIAETHRYPSLWQ